LQSDTRLAILNKLKKERTAHCAQESEEGKNIMKKKNLFALLCVCAVLLSGCARNGGEPDTATAATADSSASTSEQAATSAPEALPDEQLYIGEYNDQDSNEPNLEIAKGDDGSYVVQIGIYRLTALSDGVGTLTADGMTFTATDAAGNPIGGVITSDGETAAVTLTDSTWELLENGSTFQYTKTSDTPALWAE
jgi:hypothetical protein